MSEKAGEDWKDQVCDVMSKFADEAFSNCEDANQILIQDVGQAHLVADAIRPLFPTVNFARGDAGTAQGIGRLLGHYESLLLTLAHSVELFTALKNANDVVIDTKNKIDALLDEHMPEATRGPEAGVIHLLSAYTNPDLCAMARKNLGVFREKMQWVLQLIHSQSATERKQFLAGYGEAMSCTVIGSDGLPTSNDKEASYTALLRPFALTLELTNSEFQDVVEHFAQAKITGHPERFAKYLQRHKAPLRGKGRPSKKTSKVVKRKRGKSDNL